MIFDELQDIISTLDVDPALLDDFERRSFYPWSTVGPAARKMKGAAAIKAAPDEEEANDIVSDTAALSTISKHFKFEGYTFSTLLDSNGWGLG